MEGTVKIHINYMLELDPEKVKEVTAGSLSGSKAVTTASYDTDKDTENRIAKD